MEREGYFCAKYTDGSIVIGYAGRDTVEKICEFRNVVEFDQFLCSVVLFRNLMPEEEVPEVFRRAFE